MKWWSIILIYIDNIVYIFSYFIISSMAYYIRDCKPNKLYGYRSKISFKSQKNWKILNLYCCYYTLIILHIFIVLNIITLVLKIFFLKNEFFISLSQIFLPLFLTLEFIYVIIRMKKIEKHLK